MGVLLFLVAAGSGEGFTLERTAKVISLDTLGRVRETHRRERVKYQDGNLRIEDLTYGESLLIRTDRKSVWKIDALAGTYSELTFDQVRARQKEVLDEIRGARDRVKGSAEEAELAALLQQYGWFDAEPTVTVQSTGRAAKIAGRECRGVELAIGDRYVFSDAYVDPTLPAAGYFETLNRLSSLPEKILDRFKEIGGVPLRGRSRPVLFLERLVSEEEVTSVAVGEIPAADFEPPKDLRRVPLKGFDKPEPRKVPK